MYFGLSANPEEIIFENNDFLRIACNSTDLQDHSLYGKLITAENKS